MKIRLQIDFVAQVEIFQKNHIFLYNFEKKYTRHPSRPKNEKLLFFNVVKKRVGILKTLICRKNVSTSQKILFVLKIETNFVLLNNLISL